MADSFGDDIAELTFGELIKYLRERKDLGVREFSRRSGIALSHSQYIHTDVRRPRELTIRKIAKAVEVSPEWLLLEQKKREAMELLMKVGISRRVAYLLTNIQPLNQANEERLVKAIERIQKKPR